MALNEAMKANYIEVLQEPKCIQLVMLNPDLHIIGTLCVEKESNDTNTPFYGNVHQAR